MSTSNKIKKTRKPGSGRKRKIGAITSQDYAEQLKQLEKREAMCVYMTPQQKEAFRKEKRSLSNKLSALRSREKKRAKLDQLENAVKLLQQEVEGLRRENQALRQTHSSTSSTEDLHQIIEFLKQENQTLRQHSSSHTENTCDIPIRKRSRSSYTVSAKESSCSLKKTSLAPSSPSLSSISLEAQKISTPVKPRTHNCRSALGDAVEDFAFDIFDALDSVEDFDSIEDKEGVFAVDSDLPADTTFFETDFLEDAGFEIPSEEVCWE